jgi:Carboxypeptidase regulatory-like domain
VICIAHPRRISVLSTLLLFILCGLSGRAQDGNGSPGQRVYEVRGTVVNSVTHEPIARALVTIAGETSSSQLTDNEGRFEFPNASAGRGVLQARRPGFFGTNYGRDALLPIEVGPNAQDHILTLEPAGSITGRVTMPASDPGSNIRIQLMHRGIQEGRACWQTAGMKLTNSEGTFRFGNLQPGDYKLYTASSIDPDAPASQAPVRWGFPAVLYPEEGDNKATGFLRIGPGQQLNAQLALTREPFYSVTIPVANRVDQGYSIQISDERGGPHDMSAAYDSRQQQFRAYLPSGSYTVTLQSYMPSPGFASEPITVRNAPLQLRGLTVLPVHPIPVTIRKEFTATNSGGPQIIDIENGKQVEVSRDINLTLFSTTNQEFVGVNLRHEPGGDDSSWVLENVSPGKYWVQTYANQGYVAAISAGGTDLTRDPLVIGPGGTSASIEIVLRNDVATLSVRLKNISPPPIDAATPTEAFVTNTSVQTPLGYLYLVPQFDTSSVVQQAMPLQPTANIPNLQPGTYRVLALDRPFDLEYRNPKALEAYSGKGQTITLEPNGTANIDLDVVTAEAPQ